MPPTMIKSHFLVLVGFSTYKNKKTGGRGRIRTDERTKRADLQSASFSHLDTLPAKEWVIMNYRMMLARR